MASNISIVGMKLLLNPAMIEKICKIISNKTDKFPLGFGGKFVTVIKILGDWLGTDRKWKGMKAHERDDEKRSASSHNTWKTWVTSLPALTFPRISEVDLILRLFMSWKRSSKSDEAVWQELLTKKMPTVTNRLQSGIMRNVSISVLCRGIWL